MADDLKDVYDRLYRYCFYRIRNSAAAEDAVQEAFLRYFAQNKRLDRGEDMAYLYVIAKNLCADHFRQKRAEALPEDSPAEDFSDTSDTKVAVRAALERLDERHREIVILRYISGLSVNEAAEAIGISRFAEYRMERAALSEMKKYLEGALWYET